MVSTNNKLPIINEATNELLTSNALSQEETRKILTPFAFEIDKSLFGIPLASPTKRALAVGIDLFFIALLTETPGEILALVIAITLYRLGSKKKVLKLGRQKGKIRRKALRILAVFIFFVILLQVLPSIFNPSFVEPVILPAETVNRAAPDLTTTEAIAFSALSGTILLTVSDSECLVLTCWKDELSPLIKPFASLNLQESLLESGIEEIVEATELEKTQRTQLIAHLTDVYFQTFQQKTSEKDTVNSSDFVKHKSVEETANNLVRPITSEPLKAIENKKDKRPVYSIIELFKGLIEDLGLGFGWAAFYFTVFTALWHGQTPGKKALGIRVLQLDGTPLSMWDSFGRYGGYGAGLATGLLGFIQVFWNPNRQAIQDQISATVVIDDRKVNIKTGKKYNFKLAKASY